MYDELKAAEDERLAKEAAEMAAEDGESSHREDDKASVSSGKKGKNSAKYVMYYTMINDQSLTCKELLKHQDKEQQSKYCSLL